MKQSIPWHDYLMEHLADPENAMAYLHVSLEEYLEDGNTRFFLEGIRNVVEAQGGIFSFSQQVKVLPKFFEDAIYGGAMLPFSILDNIFTYFGWDFMAGDFVNPSNLVGVGEIQSTLVMEDSYRSMSPSPSEVLTEPITTDNLTEGNLTERQEQNFKYWRHLKPHLSWLVNDIKPLQANESHFQDLSIMNINCALRVRQTVRPKEISVAFIMRGARATGNFYSLRIEQEEIEKEFGDKLEWWPKVKSEKRISYRNTDADPTDEADWHNQHQWLDDMLKKLYGVFKPRVERLIKEF